MTAFAAIATGTLFAAAGAYALRARQRPRVPA